MNVIINGKEETVSNGINIVNLLKEKDVRMPEMVSVELNGEILASDSYDTATLNENDNIEFLYFMGGGA